MKTVIVCVLCIAASVFATGIRDNAALDCFTRAPALCYGSPDAYYDALFIFLAYDDYVPDSSFACGDSYWNPLSQSSGTGWSINSFCGSWSQPEGAPYHWNGGLGTAMDALGYSWYWFPGYTGRCGQSIPGVNLLNYFDCVFVMTFDAYRSVTLTGETRATLESYIDGGGHVILVSQDARYSGVPEEWLDNLFSTGTIQQDVVTGSGPFPVNGMMSSFMLGWSGTALMENFSTGAGGASTGQWWADGLSGCGCITNGTYVFSTYNEYNGCLFSTFDFEACAASEVQEITSLLMEWMVPSSLQRSTWGAVKSAGW